MAEADDVDLSFEALTFGDAEPVKPKAPKKEKKKYVPDEKEESGEPEPNVLLIATNKFGDKLNWPELLQAAETFGPVKNQNFRDKQSFGFVQYDNEQDYERALVGIHDLEVDGVKVTAEKCARISAGRDPRTHDADSEFKNTTLVLKNLPFNLKLEQLQEILSQQQYAPLNVAYLYDAAAMFRGMAFVKYREIEQAQVVFQAVNGMDIHGRKLRIEYKRTLKEGEGGEDDKKLFEQLTNFKATAQHELPGTSPDLSFHCSSSFQRKSLHQMAEKLGLVHYSTGEGENQFVVVRYKDSMMGNNNKGDAPDPKGRDIRRRGSNAEPKHSLEAKATAASWGGFASAGVGSWNKSKSPDDRSGGFSFSKMANAHPRFGSSPGREFRSPLSQSPGGFGSLGVVSPPGAQAIPTPGTSAPVGSAASFGTSPSYRNSAAIMNRRMSKPGPESIPTIQISRQPRGPDGTNGFSAAYRTARSNSKPTPPEPEIIAQSV